MRKTILIALGLSAALAAPAFAADRVVVTDNGWAPTIIVRQGHRGYWDEHHHWRRMVVVNHRGHRGYWDYHHRWHDWRG
jgi:hypothetical protein